MLELVFLIMPGQDITHPCLPMVKLALENHGLLWDMEQIKVNCNA